MRFKAGCRALAGRRVAGRAGTDRCRAGSRRGAAGHRPEPGPQPGGGWLAAGRRRSADTASSRLGAGIEFNDGHYLRRNLDGSVTATVFGYQDELDGSPGRGYDIWRHDRGSRHSGAEHARAYVQGPMRQDARAGSAAQRPSAEATSHQDEIVIPPASTTPSPTAASCGRGRTASRGARPAGPTYVGPDLSLSYNPGGNTPIDSPPRVMSTNIDPDTTPDTT